MSIVKVEIPKSLPKEVDHAEKVGISRITLDFHLKIWQEFSEKLNHISEQLNLYQPDPYQVTPFVDDFRSLKLEYTCLYSAYMNHKIFFNSLGDPESDPSDQILEQIQNDFGSFENWSKDWAASGMAARQWVFLAYDIIDKRLFNYIGDSPNTFCIWDHVCIMAMDVAEHSYFYDFKTTRASYIDAFIKTINWHYVNKEFEKAITKFS